MTVAETSLIAYHSLDDEKVIKVRDRILLTVAIATHPSNADIERLTDIRLSSICGRVNELKADGLIEQGGTKTDPFTHKAVAWLKLTDRGVELVNEIAKGVTV